MIPAFKRPGILSSNSVLTVKSREPYWGFVHTRVR
jgi:hypothetical protein